MKDYYSLLGVEKNATKAEVKKNFYRLATKFHPDKNPDPTAASKFIRITEAYDVLSNKKLRAQYDLSRWETLKRAKDSKDSYTVVVPQRQSSRTRRYKAQQNRALRYFETKGEITNWFQLLYEGLHIASRYIFHVLSLALMAVILVSAVSQLYAFEMGLAIAMGVLIFSTCIVYAMLKIVQDIYTEIKIDITLFSINYKIVHSKAALFSLSVFGFGLLLFVTYLQFY